MLHEAKQCGCTRDIPKSKFHIPQVCEHAEGVIPLCRTCHRIYDDASKRASLDLLPKLIDRGYFAELAHPISAHSIGPVTVLEHVTGQEWQTGSSPELPIEQGVRQ